MGTLMIVVFQIFADDVTQLPLACQNQLVQAFLLYGLVEGFDVSVVLWLAWRDALGSTADGFEDALKLLCEKRIVVVDKICHILQFTIEHISLVSCDLRHPLSVGSAFDSATPYFACGDVFEEEDMGALKTCRRRHFVSNEVTSGQHILVGVIKLRDIGIAALFRKYSVAL